MPKKPLIVFRPFSCYRNPVCLRPVPFPEFVETGSKGFAPMSSGMQSQEAGRTKQRCNRARSLGYLAQPKASAIVRALFRNGEMLGIAGQGMPMTVQSLRAFNARDCVTRSDGKDADVSIEELCGAHGDLHQGRWQFSGAALTVLPAQFR